MEIFNVYNEEEVLVGKLYVAESLSIEESFSDG